VDLESWRAERRWLFGVQMVNHAVMISTAVLLMNTIKRKGSLYL
jgi:hypothetical protein